MAQLGPPQNDLVRLSGGGNGSLGDPVCAWSQGSLWGRREQELAQYRCGSVCSEPFNAAFVSAPRTGQQTEQVAVPGM